jgi:type I restriction enzyme R subunit
MIGFGYINFALVATYLRQGETRSVRPYQQSAMQALDRAVELGKRRFLMELPTGCGRTDVMVLYIKRLIQAGHAERILFLVDREQLAKQAIEAIQDLLPSYSSYWHKPGMVRQEKQITVSLLQTMIGRYRDFTRGYFDVVMMDECHRSIYGTWQTALSYFDALHIGLTATVLTETLREEPLNTNERTPIRTPSLCSNRRSFATRGETRAATGGGSVVQIWNPVGRHAC